MSEANIPVQHEYFLRGRARLWFWAALSYIPLTVFSPYISNWLTVYLISYRNEALLAGIAAANAALLSFGWAALFLIFGLYNRVKTFRNVFILLFFAQILYFGYLLFSGYFGVMLSIRAYNQGQTDPTEIIKAVSLFIYLVAWLVSIITTLCSRKSNALLRVSAVTVLLFLALTIGVQMFSSQILEYIDERYGRNADAAMNNVFVNFTDSIKYIAYAFLLGAMAFSRMKPAKAGAVNQPSTVG